jgi:4-alpha-glucanotransferase
MRNSGILLAVSSLPSSYGIGDFGKQAYQFIDLMVKAKQNYGKCCRLIL